MSETRFALLACGRKRDRSSFPPTEFELPICFDFGDLSFFVPITGSFVRTGAILPWSLANLLIAFRLVNARFTFCNDSLYTLLLL
jgi:hypothetical protein